MRHPLHPDSVATFKSTTSRPLGVGTRSIYRPSPVTIGESQPPKLHSDTSLTFCHSLNRDAAMAPESHPRRRGFKAAPRLSTKDVPLRKSGTFHSPNHLSSDVCDPLENSNFMPKRSHTNPAALEQLLVDAGEQRVASVLASVDRALSGNSSISGDASILKDSSVLPVPGFLLGNTGSDPDEMQTDQKKPAVDHHETDSGLGSSISGSNSGKAAFLQSLFDCL